MRKRTCAPSEDSDQPAHLRSLIRIFPWRSLDSQGCKDLFKRTKKPLIRLCACAGWFESLLGTHVRKYVSHVKADMDVNTGKRFNAHASTNDCTLYNWSVCTNINDFRVFRYNYTDGTYHVCKFHSNLNHSLSSDYFFFFFFFCFFLFFRMYNLVWLKTFLSVTYLVFKTIEFCLQ